MWTASESLEVDQVEVFNNVYSYDIMSCLCSGLMDCLGTERLAYLDIEGNERIRAWGSRGVTQITSTSQGCSHSMLKSFHFLSKRTETAPLPNIYRGTNHTTQRMNATLPFQQATDSDLPLLPHSPSSANSDSNHQPSGSAGAPIPVLIRCSEQSTLEDNGTVV